MAESQKTVDNLLPQLFGPGQGRRGKAQGYSNDIEQARRRGDTVLEQAYVDSLITYTLDNYQDGNLIGGQSTATQDRVLNFIYALYCASGISPIPDLSGIFSAENTVLIRNGTPNTTVTVPLNDGTVIVEQGDVPSTQDGQPFFGTFVSVYRTSAPLATSLDWYGLDGYKQGAFEFVANPPVTFTSPVTTGVCVRFDNAVVNAQDLRLAHQVEPGAEPAVPGNEIVTTAGGTIEVFAPVSTASLNLSCAPITVASGGFGRFLQRLADVFLPARLVAVVEMEEGGIGGQADTFSPFAAIDLKLVVTGTGPSSPQYIPVGSSSISAPVSASVKTRHPAGQTPIGGVIVDFAGAFTPASAATDANGTATSSWTLVGGTNTGTAVPSLSPLSFNGSPVNFSVAAIQILPVVVSVSPAPPAGTVSVEYSPFAFAATGGTGVFSWSVAGGAVPPGLSLSSSGILSGTPTATGSFTFSVRATSGPAGLEVSGDATFTVVIALPPVDITTTSLPAAVRGVAYSASLGATGGTGTYVWSLADGSLPDGLTLSGNTISGTPSITASTSGFTVQATSGASSDAQALTITVGWPTAVSLSFVVAPAKSRCYAVDQPLTPGIVVKATDGSGNLLSGVEVRVVAVTNNGSNVVVTPSSVTSSGGYAAFGGPTINKTGGYALIISTGAPWPVVSVTSGKFTVSPACS